MFNTLKNLTKAVVNTAILPVDMGLDFITMGGELVDKKRSFTGKRFSKITKNIDEIGN